MPQNSRNMAFTSHIWVHLNTASTWAFHFLASFSIAAPAFDIFTSISRHFRAAFRSLSCSLSRLARLQFLTYFNQIIASANLTLQAFLQLQYQGVNDQSHSVFATHPAAMRVAVASSVVYYLAYAALIRFPLHPFSSVAHHVLVSSGYISVASLASTLLSGAAAVFVYAIFGSLSAVELLCLLQNEEESWFQRRRILHFLNNIWGRRQSLSPPWMRRLPV